MATRARAVTRCENFSGEVPTQKTPTPTQSVLVAQHAAPSHQFRATHHLPLRHRTAQPTIKFQL